MHPSGNRTSIADTINEFDGGKRFSGFGHPMMNASRQVLFVARLEGDTEDGIWLSDNGALHE